MSIFQKGKVGSFANPIEIPGEIQLAKPQQ